MPPPTSSTCSHRSLRSAPRPPLRPAGEPGRSGPFSPLAAHDPTQVAVRRSWLNFSLAPAPAGERVGERGRRWNRVDAARRRRIREKDRSLATIIRECLQGEPMGVGRRCDRGDRSTRVRTPLLNPPRLTPGRGRTVGFARCLAPVRTPTSDIRRRSITYCDQS